MNNAVVLNLLNKIDVKKVSLNVISDDRYTRTLVKIIDDYSLGGVTRSDIVNIIDAFSATNLGLTFDKDMFVDSIWGQLVNIQSYKNSELLKQSIYTFYNFEMLTDVEEGRLLRDDLASRQQELTNLVEKYIHVTDFVNIDETETLKILYKIDSLYPHYTVEPSLIYNDLGQSISLSILKNNVLLSLVTLLGEVYEPLIREVLDIHIKVNLDDSVVDDIVYDILDRTNLQVKDAFDTHIKSVLMEDISKYKNYEGDPINPIDIQLTPETFTTGNLVIEEADFTANLSIQPTETHALMSVEENNVNVTVKPVDEFVKVAEHDVQAKIIEPQFRVKVSSANCGLPIDPDDKWKVITNDGESAQWESVANLLGPQIGFLKIVDTLGERNAIPLHQRTMGMLVYVKMRDTYYKCESTTDDSWTIFKQGLYPHRLARTVIYENVKLGHGDKGSDLRIGDVKSTAINTLGDYRYVDEFADVEYANLISFKNIGYAQAEIQFDGNTHILNPNSVFELPFDGTLRFKIKGVFNFVSAFVTFDTEVEAIKAQCCDPIRHKYEMESIFDPYF